MLQAATSPLREDEDFKITYGQFGRNEAQSCNGTPSALKESLPILYDKIVEDAKLDKEGVARHLNTLEQDLLTLETQRDNLVSKVKTAEQAITDAEKEIDDIENHRAGNGDVLSFVIGTIITILLTLYLWAFYAASGYGAWNGISPGKAGFAGIFASLGDAFDEGGIVVVITLLFPVIFLALGFLIHEAMEKKKYVKVIIFLLFTLSVDIIIGYNISRFIHINAFNAGETEITWQPNFIYYDVTFYFVLASGFACYVMWGFLLHYILNKKKELETPNRIKKLNTRISELRAEILQVQANINNCETKIKKTTQSIAEFKSGKVFVNVDKLKANIGHFMNGWIAFITFKYPGDKIRAEESVRQSMEIKDQWLKEKIATLDYYQVP